MKKFKKFCPKCKDSGDRSEVYPGLQTSTLMGGTTWYDEDGEYHNHNPNRSAQAFRCSKGHDWYEYSYSNCPSCSYTSKPKEK